MDTSKPKTQATPEKNETTVSKIDSATLKANWAQLKSVLKEKYSKLNESDLTQMGSKPEQIVATLQTKSGESRENIEAFLTKSLEKIAKKA